MAEIRLSRLDEQLLRTRVLAPFDGVVSQRHVRTGAEVSYGEGLLRFMDVNALEVVSQVPAQHQRDIRPGTRVRIVSERGESAGRVRALVPANQRRGAVFELVADVESGPAEVVVGDIVRLKVPVGAQANGLFVRRDAMVLRGDGIYLYRISGKSRVQRVGVRLGVANGEWISVTGGGLQINDQAVVRGAETLRDGQEVQLLSDQVPQVTTSG